MWQVGFTCCWSLATLTHSTECNVWIQSFPLNPSEITDRQIEPSEAVHYQTSSGCRWCHSEFYSSPLKKRLSPGRGTRRGMMLMILGILLGWKLIIQLMLVVFVQGRHHPLWSQLHNLLRLVYKVQVAPKPQVLMYWPRFSFYHIHPKG